MGATLNRRYERNGNDLSKKEGRQQGFKEFGVRLGEDESLLELVHGPIDIFFEATFKGGYYLDIFEITKKNLLI